MSVSVPPAPGPPRDAQLPTPVERVLDNGLRVVAFSQRNLPLAVAQLVMRGGGSSEHEDEAGLAAMVSALLTAGTTVRGATEIAATADALGAQISAISSFDASLVMAASTTPAFPQAFALLAEIVRRPAFAPAEVERVRARSISDLALAYANPSALARYVAQRVAYGGSCYGHPLAGTAATLRELRGERVAWFHERFYRPDGAALVIGGDMTTDDAFALAERVLGSWRAPAAPLEELPGGAIPTPRAQVVIVDKPDAGRTALAAGRVAVERRSPDFYPATVACAVLSGYSGRLNQEIRVKRGLSYGAGASLSARRLTGTFVASTLVEHARAAEATQVTLDAIRSLVDAPATDDDLIARKATVTGAFYRVIETTDGVASSLADHVLNGVPLEELAEYPHRVLAVDATAVRDVARRTVVDDRFVVLVGDAPAFAPAVEAMLGPARTIPFDRLDLGDPGLGG